MGRWTQYDEDEYRLPEGVKRIAYDADTGVYTYRDQYSGRLYEGLPRQQYGALIPKAQSPAERRPMFDKDKQKLNVDTKKSESSPKSFSDIVSPDKVTAASPISEGSGRIRSPTSPSMDPKSRFINAVRRATMPKMQDVVQSVMNRSNNTTRPADSESITEKLIPKDASLSQRKDATPVMTERKSVPLMRSATTAGNRFGSSFASSLARSSTTAGNRSGPSLTRSSTTSTQRSSSSVSRSSTTSSHRSSATLTRAATNASTRSGASLARSATTASTRSTTSSITHLMNAKPMREASLKDLPGLPADLAQLTISSPSTQSTKRSSHSDRSPSDRSSSRRAVEAV